MNIANKLSLKSLHLLAIVAKHKHLIDAANELNISASAVSHQIKRLEDKLGFAITYRQGKQLKLTLDAQQFAHEIYEHFDAINNATVNFVHSEDKPISLGVESAFAVNRLIPALSLWQAELEGLDVRVRMLNCDDKPAELGLDLVFGNQVIKKAYQSDLVKAEQYFAVCTPNYQKRLLQFSSSNIFANANLLELEKVDGWQKWFSLTGYTANVLANMIYFSHTLLLFKAVLNHQGVALLEASLIKDELAAGTLIIVNEQSLQLPELNYYVSVHQRHKKNAQIEKLKSLMIGLL